jgi:hypothetical protein
MGRGDRPKVRWKNERIRKKRERDERRGQRRGEARKAEAQSPSQ